MNEELETIIFRLHGALYSAQNGNPSWAQGLLSEVDKRRAGISSMAIPPMLFRDVVITTLGAVGGNLYLLEYDALERSIDRALHPEESDEHEEGLVNNVLEGLTGSKLLRLALEKILEEKGVTYKELTGVKTAWHPQDEDLELELIVTKRMTVTTA